VQTHEEHDNSLTSRIIGAIALRPTGNLQVRCYFFSLTSGRILNRSRWTSLPIPQEVIDHVERMARRDLANGPGLLLADRNGHPFMDDDDTDDGSYHPLDGDSDDENSNDLDADDIPNQPPVIAGVNDKDFVNAHNPPDAPAEIKGVHQPDIP
jgi:hypothetical protein